MHSAACSSPALPMKDVISQRALLSKSTHKWSLNLICQQACWDGRFAVNTSSVGEESPSRRMPSHEQFMLSVWMHPPAASHGIFIAVPGSGVPNPLGHALKASSLQRTAQKFGNATALLLTCHSRPFSGFILQGWFTSDLHHCVSAVC